jgi:uncharacterized membrane protein
MMLVAAILSPLVGGLIGWLTLRQSRQANKDTIKIEERKVDAENWQALTERLGQDVSRIPELWDRIDRLESKVGALETTLTVCERQLRLAMSYVRDLLVFIRMNNLNPPEPPPDLDLG